jgi:hypothetical protein
MATDQDLVAPPPEHCPGPQSKEAGHAPSCAGCPNANICKTMPKGPDPGMYDDGLVDE